MTRVPKYVNVAELEPVEAENLEIPIFVEWWNLSAFHASRLARSDAEFAQRQLCLAPGGIDDGQVGGSFVEQHTALL